MCNVYGCKKVFLPKQEEKFRRKTSNYSQVETVKESENNIDQTPPPPLLGFSNKVRFYNSTIYYIPLLISAFNEIGVFHQNRGPHKQVWFPREFWL